MANPILLSVINSYGIELLHSTREGRSKKQIGKKGLLNKHWLVGGKSYLLLKKFGLAVDWDFGTANQYDTGFH